MRAKHFIAALSLILAGLLVIAALYTLTGPGDGPAHERRSLSQWLELGREPDRAEEAEEAIRALGPKALPHLERLVISQRDTSKLHLAFLIRRFGGTPPTIQAHDFADASFGFRSLGSESIPSLSRLLDARSPNVRSSALMIAGGLEDKAMPLLPRLIAMVGNDPVPALRSKAAQTLGEIGSSPEIVEALTQALKAQDEKVRLYAALALGRFDTSKVSDRVWMPLLWNHAFNGSETASRGGIHPSSTNALPALRNLSADPNRNVQAAAQFAIQTIESMSASLAPQLDQP
jgi:HEAT repeat protein